MHDDTYQMYIEELEMIPACTQEEELELLQKISHGDQEAKKRLLEGSLGMVVEQAKAYKNQGLPMGDLIQEANIALIMAVDCFAAEQGEAEQFRADALAQIQEALKAAVEEQKMEEQVEGEMLARVNVLKEVCRRMAEELGREATVPELAGKMKMTEDEIRDIMKLTLDAMSVSPDVEE